MMLPVGLPSARLGALGKMLNAVDAKRDARHMCPVELGMNPILLIFRTKRPS